MKYLIVYHKDCVDGFAAMALLSEVLKNEPTRLDVRTEEFSKEEKTYSCVYSMSLGIQKVSKVDKVETLALHYHERDAFLGRVATLDENTIVYVLDFSFTPEQLSQWAHRVNKVIVIDHHAKAIQDWANAVVPSNVELIFDESKSGALLTFEYVDRMSETGSVFHRDNPVIINAIRRVWVERFWKMLSDYDLHAFREPDADCVALNTFIRAYDYMGRQDTEGFIELASEGTYRDVIEDGKGMLKAEEVLIKTILRTNTKVMSVIGPGGLIKSPLQIELVPVANVPYALRDRAGTLLNEQYPDALFSATYDDQVDALSGRRIRRWSFRSKIAKCVDMNAILAFAGLPGGGHSTAAGYTQYLE